MKKFLALFLCLLSLGLLAGCGDEETAVEKDPLVKTMVIGDGTGDSSGKYPGTVKGRYETNMAFQVSGRILQRNVQVGDRVHAGQVLMVIDDRDVVQSSNQGDAQVAAAKAQLELARSNLNRYSALYAQEAISASVLDQYQTAYNAAQASYDQAVAAATQGHNSLGYTNLIATSDGVVSAINVEAGQVVSAGTPVLTLVQTNELEVETSIPESRIGEIALGQQADVSFWSLKGQSVTGTIREIAPMADSVARTYRVRISLPQRPEGLQLGMTASAKFAGMAAAQAAESDNAAILPISAIFQNGDTAQVWLVDKDSLTLSLQTVQVEDFSANELKVHGLKDGDIVVTAGVHKLREGTKVRLTEGNE